MTQFAASPSTIAFSTSAPVLRFTRRPSRLIVGEEVLPGLEWSSPVIDRLEELVRLENGWDGYNGEPVSFLNANFALRMLEAICSVSTPAPQIVPGSSGDLQIEWHLPHAEIELHVRAPNDVVAWHLDATTTDDGEELALTNDFASVARWIENLERLGASAAAA
jgi:hypothetical protein